MAVGTAVMKTAVILAKVVVETKLALVLYLQFLFL